MEGLLQESNTAGHIVIAVKGFIVIPMDIN
jgi:hypothetical protein